MKKLLYLYFFLLLPNFLFSQQAVYRIKGSMASNIWLVKVSNQWLMVDSGGSGDSSKIKRGLKNLGLTTDSIAYLILTHGHTDHAGSAAFMQRAGVPIIAGAGDKALLKRGQNEPLCPTNGMAKMLVKKAESNRAEASSATIWVEGIPYDLRLKGIDAQILPLSGHTNGSLVLRVGEVAFVGDLLRGRPMAPHHPARHYYLCDLNQNTSNIQALLANEEVKLWYPGHFGRLKVERIKGLRFLDREPERKDP